MLRDERVSRRRRVIYIVLCVVAGISLGVWHNRAARRGGTDALTSTTRTATAPLVTAVSATGRWIARQVGWLFEGRTLAAENARLRAENAALHERTAALQEADIELQRLRGQMGFQQSPPGPKLAADVIAVRTTSSFRTIVIGRGSRGGVKAQSVVVTPYGLVGRVYDVAPTTATVLLITDSNSAVGAMVQRAASRATGVCRGTGDGLLSMLYLDRDADVKPGDAIVSSGLGGDRGVFPKGLVVGTVASVANDASGSSRRVMVRPAVNLGRLEEVFVLP